MDASGDPFVSVHRCHLFQSCLVGSGLSQYLSFVLSESVESVPLVASLVVLFCTSTQHFCSLLCLCFVSAVILCISSL